MHTDRCGTGQQLTFAADTAVSSAKCVAVPVGAGLSRMQAAVNKTPRHT